MQNKRIRVRLMIAVILMLLCIPGVTGCAGKGSGVSAALSPHPSEEGGVPLRQLIDPASEVRGVYIASVYNIDFPSKPDLSDAALRQELDAILDTMQNAGLNTVFFQVRPACDALYRSTLFPVSASLYSDGELHFDPLAYLVEAAHSRNIFVHAWVNPLRVTVGSAARPNVDPAALPDGSPAKEHPEWTVAYADGKLYLDPGIPEVRTLVADGVREIVENYSVDGVIFDDYFYPYPVTDAAGVTAAFDDGDSFSRFGGGLSLAAWRRENVNRMVREVYDSVKEADADVLFGVAPFGIWRNDDGKNGGSATRGLQAYDSIYCDAVAWAEGGYVDYIAPQIYWRFSTQVAPYGELVRWWNRVLDGTGVDLLVSHAAYNYDEWSDPEGEMAEQIRFARSELTYRGSIFYGYDEIRRDSFSLAGELWGVFRDEIVYTAPSPTGISVNVSSPPDGTWVNAEATYLIGSSSPDKPLLLNGEKISRTRGGFFSAYVPLTEGENVFEFVQGDSVTRYTVNRGTPAADSGENAAAGMENFSVLSVSPARDILRESGTVLTVSCTAPAGADVTAELNGISVTLRQTDKPKPVRSGYAAASYSGTLTLPEAAPDEILSLGTITVCAVSGENEASGAGAGVRVRGSGAFVPVRVTKDNTELKLRQNSYYYDDFSVQSAGMTDQALWQGGGMYLLRVGGYVYEDAVEEVEDERFVPLGKLGEITVFSENGTTFVRAETDRAVPHNGTVRDGVFELTLYNIDVSSVPETVTVADNPMIREVRITYPNKVNCVRFLCTLKDADNFYGFDFTYGDGFAAAILREPLRLSQDAGKPLSGICIALDAGHGGTDTGALGPLAVGGAIHEKDLNLMVTLAAGKRLEELGATVLLTRSEDSTVPIYDRVDRLCEIMPDLAISIHQNSLGYSSDITRVRGTVGLWWADGGELLAECVSHCVARSLARREMTATRQKLALCRNPKFPSALIEVGFMTSVEEYEYMLNGGVQDAADGIAQGVLLYFSEISRFADGN